MDYRRGVAHLKRSDPTMRRVVDRVGPCEFEPDTSGDRFAALLEAILYQQLQGKAAGAISARFQALYNGVFPTPRQLLETPPGALRGAGLSPQKEGYMRDLAARVESGSLDLTNIHQLDDGALVEALTQVKGIGDWTAHMFLVFHLGRLDVLPTGDYGLRKAVQREYHLRVLPEASKLERIARPWRPYRTLATWYLWQSTEAVLPGARGG